MRTFVVAATLTAATLALTACGGGDDKPSTAPGVKAPAATHPTATRTVAWGQPAEVLGANQTTIRVTPQALLYDKGSKDAGTPANGWFVAISVKAEATTGPDTTSGGMYGGGFQWRGAGQTITEMDGEASNTAWVGASPEFTVDSPIEPGDPREGIVTFDIPSKTGGQLVYLSPEDNTITASWDIPAADQGSTPGLTKVRKRIQLFR